ncbi:MAG: proline racemase family protein, partial [Thermodesulfobacteriota bacterium]
LLKGRSLVEKERYMQENWDLIRTGTMLEPRGHADMFGAYLAEPTAGDADLAVLFFDGGAYYSMCGHGAMAVAIVALETGMVPQRDSPTPVRIETTAGVVTVETWKTERGTWRARLRGVPSFLFASDVPLEIDGMKVLVEIAYGGNFFVLVPSCRLGLRHDPADLDKFIRYGSLIREQANARVAVTHPELPHIDTIKDVLFYMDPQEAGGTYKSLVFLGRAQLDRSPCGTGTCARMAVLHARGRLKRGELFRHESIIGTVFEGRIGAVTSVGSLPAILPEVTGEGFVTSWGTLVIDTSDSLSSGFLLR